MLEDEAFCHITELMERARTAGLRVGVFPISDKSWVDIGEWPAYRESLLSYSETQ